MIKWKLIALFLLCGLLIKGQDTLRIMQYNLLMYGDNFGGCTSANNNVNDKNAYLKTIVDYVNPDIVFVNELYKDAYFHDLLLNQVFNTNGGDSFSRSFPPNYSFGFTVNMAFYKNSKISLLSDTALSTSIRDIDLFDFEYQAANQKSAVPFHCVVAHLKAGNSNENAVERAAETAKLMNFLNESNATGNYTFSGDFNVYTASEDAFQNLVFNTNTDIRFYDPLNEMGSWNNNSYYSGIHTQSTHTSGDCFSGGGLDDRFDFILVSDEIKDGNQKIYVVPGSYHALGQDGEHFNQALTSSPVNTSVPANVLNALYNMSDHLPVVMDLVVENNLSIQNNSEGAASLQMKNPVGDELRFTLVSQPNQKIRCHLLNSLGKVIFEQSYSTTGTLHGYISTEGLKPGLYLLQFEFEKEFPLTRKILVHRAK